MEIKQLNSVEKQYVDAFGKFGTFMESDGETFHSALSKGGKDVHSAFYENANRAFLGISNDVVRAEVYEAYQPVFDLSVEMMKSKHSSQLMDHSREAFEKNSQRYQDGQIDKSNALNVIANDTKGRQIHEEMAKYLETVKETLATKEDVKKLVAALNENGKSIADQILERAESMKQERGEVLNKFDKAYNKNASKSRMIGQTGGIDLSKVVENRAAEIIAENQTSKVEKTR